MPLSGEWQIWYNRFRLVFASSDAIWCPVVVCDLVRPEFIECSRARLNSDMHGSAQSW